MRFWKYEGLGNDFVLWFGDDAQRRGGDGEEEREAGDDPILPFTDLTSSLIQKICHRHTGVGADGVIIFLSGHPSQPNPKYRIKIFNSDGSCAAMCGNGLRCVVKMISDLEAGDQQDEKWRGLQRTYEIATDVGVVNAQLLSDGLVTIFLDPPRLFFRSNQTLPAFSPISLSLPRGTYAVIDLSLGNPHAVAFVEDIDAFSEHFPADGKALSTHEYFPGGVNAEFVQVIAPQHLRVMVWERGAGPTLACGTGACAAVVASVLLKLTLMDTPCRVTLPGGDLVIHWREEDQRLSLCGPANFVYEGRFPPPPGGPFC